MLFSSIPCLKLVPPITHLFNLSIEHNVFPSARKQAIVTPIFKSGNCYEVSNFRPISILPVLSKITEKVVIKLTTYLADGKFGLDPLQFGFRPNHSTETAALHLIEQIKLKLDKGWLVLFI